MLAPVRDVRASAEGQRARRRYQLRAPGTSQSRRRDALIVSLLAYAGLRPGELRGLRWGDIGENTIHVQRALNPDGSVKPTKTRQRRSVQLLAPLAQELREYRLAAGRPSDASLVLVGDRGQPWDGTAWHVWRANRWGPACRAADLDPAPRPYDLRHGFVSLWLAAGRQPVWVAKQAGHTPAVLYETYAHLVEEYAQRERIDPGLEVLAARSGSAARPSTSVRERSDVR
jgi:integrase